MRVKVIMLENYESESDNVGKVKVIMLENDESDARLCC